MGATKKSFAYLSSILVMPILACVASARAEDPTPVPGIIAAPATAIPASSAAPTAATTAAATSTSTAPAPIEVHIDKSDHTLKIMRGTTVVKQVKVALGPGGAGPKQYEGDEVTPVGKYKIVSHWKGLFHQFFSIDYPNAEDKKRYAENKKKGLIPKGTGIGFGVGIHGVGDKSLSGVHKNADWTLGCIAMDDEEIDEFAKHVKDGTTVIITD